jgi:Flp pilus assembly protein TadG
MKQIRDFCLGQSGAAAVEFGLVLPVLIMLMLGVISCSMLGGTISGMHYAVEEAARCFAVNKTACGTSADAAAFARARYMGPTSVTPTFEATNTGCGFTVSGTATFQLQFAIVNLNVPLSTSACYPGKPVAA